MNIPYEKQIDPARQRGCGAASLAMVYRSFGKDVPQEAIWPAIAKPNRFGQVSSTTHLMTAHAMSQGFAAMAIQARHPMQVLRICRDAGIRAILNHRVQAGSPVGHYTVLVDLDDKNVVLHDPLAGAAQRITHAELAQLWQPVSANSEIAGNVLIGIAQPSAPTPACEFCHTTIPAQIKCPSCGKAVALAPAPLLGCIRDGCIARMWNYVSCPSCDFFWSFNETDGPPVAFSAAPPKLTEAPLPEMPPLEKVFEAIDTFCAKISSMPGLADRADLKAQLDFIRSGKDRLRAAQAEQESQLRSHADQLSARVLESRAMVEAHLKRAEGLGAPLAPLDGNALGQALLKNLGFH